MPDALTIDFALTNWSRVEKAFNSLSKLSSTAETRMKSLEAAVDGTASAYSRLNAQMLLFNRLSGNGGGSVAGPGGALAPRSSTNRLPKVNGPFQRQEKLEQQMKAAQMGGDWRQIADTRLAQTRNTAQIDKLTAGPKSFGEKFTDVLKTSRFSVGGGKGELMPLVGKTLSLATDMLGPELAALAGPIGLAAAAAVEAGKAIFDLAKNAAEAGAAFTSFQFSVGSLGKDSSQALAIGNQGGLSASATAGQANSLQNAITGSSIGRAYGMRLGVFNLAGPYGSQDYAKNYVTAMDHLRAMPLDQRILFARQTGLEGSLSATMTSDKQYALGKTDAGVHAQIFDPSFAQKSADFNAALGRVSDAATNLMTALGKPLMDGLTNFFNALATTMNNLALFLNGPIGKMIITGLAPFTSLGMVAMSAGGDSTANAQLKATQDNTKATQDLTQRIPGVYGNDTDGRLGRAFPQAAGFNARTEWRENYVTGAMRLGAF